MPDVLGQQLQRAVIPDSSARREEVVRLAIGSQLAENTASRQASNRRSRWSLRPSLAIAVVLLLLVAISLTPPGRAVADDIARLVGIGDDPTLDPSKNQDNKASGRAVVVATGTVPGTDQPVEISAYASVDRPEKGNLQPDTPGVPPIYDNSPAKPESCLNIDLPGVEHQSQVEFNSTCVTRDVKRALDFNGATEFGDDLSEQARFSVEGLVSDEVTRVEVTYEDASGERVDAPVILATLDRDVADQTGAPFTFGQFLAYLPDDGVETGGPGTLGHPIMDSVEVKALGADGKEIASDDGHKFFALPDRKPFG
jgi:hypothetical protein